MINTIIIFNLVVINSFYVKNERKSYLVMVYFSLDNLLNIEIALNLEVAVIFICNFSSLVYICWIFNLFSLPFLHSRILFGLFCKDHFRINFDF